MPTVTAIYENGVFRPIEPVDLPQGTKVCIDVPVRVIDVRALAPAGMDEALIRVYECLSVSYDTGDPFASERHNEHQP